MNSDFIPDFQIRNGGTHRGDDWSIAECWKALYRRKWLLATITGAGLLIAGLVSLAQPRWYRSQASLEVQGINENFLDLREIYQNASPGPDIDGTYLQTQAEIVEEDAVLEQVIQRLNLPDTDRSATQEHQRQLQPRQPNSADYRRSAQPETGSRHRQCDRGSTDRAQRQHPPASGTANLRSAERPTGRPARTTAAVRGRTR